MPLQQTHSPERAPLADLADAPEAGCECMLCDLPPGQEHGPVRWRVTVHFPGPYPLPGDDDMLLCEHCKNDWLSEDWPEAFDNFVILRCVPV